MVVSSPCSLAGAGPLSRYSLNAFFSETAVWPQVTQAVIEPSQTASTHIEQFRFPLLGAAYPAAMKCFILLYSPPNHITVKREACLSPHLVETYRQLAGQLHLS